MAEKDEMPVGEWCVRMTCKLFALGAAILGVGGCVLIAFKLNLPLIEAENYGAAALVSIALIAGMLFGLAPMAVEIDKAMLRLCGGMQPLPGRKDQSEQ
ncbi:hypothetical protein [Paraburkholderia sp. Ac-20347]|uniref:hypothetical protein n=1 Tax=Paraburkholderia sp. Ac-20347 TaxID=2703892 RepID=UPI00197EEC53|nr:hypothetical protein [Paraburkholderia sp. Ac-20347]MBN3813426.1 hypothetical protein [Paraburkholderia sp. Ac-20347]